ncbi:gliding motility-associated C-terminal domain-containing protein [uncultured Winogradskyella sp.]|uniref:DUF7933 domain-containing protein n=1 Tax=uncultured Winogradskyella sp. TaxID=395353 RepID=UPI00260BA576|nr:gliding motility-associated C-terminal domain-containing protein [uncultured Winogradskyella sp.]
MSSQTTDLSIAIEVQDLNGTAVSQVDIYEDFQYIITVTNSGNLVDNAMISVDFDDDLSILSYTSQNNNAGASEFSNINVNANVLTASIATIPNNGSVELLVLVTAPTNLGGIAANGTVDAPGGTTDTNTSNNQSIISIDVLDIIIDFSITHSQIQPSQGVPINAWGDTVTYQFTITNNSAIDFPVTAIEGKLFLALPPENGEPFAEFVSLECINTTNGSTCPDLTNISEFSINVSSAGTTSANTVFTFEANSEITAGGSISFEMVYRFSNYSCSEDPMQIDVNSFIQIELDHANASSNNSNNVLTNLLNADFCPETDICIETVQTDPDVNIALDYDQEITLLTTICNNGPSETLMRFFIQNLTSTSVAWEIISTNCVGTTGSVSCNDFSISSINNGQGWTSNDFILQPNTTINIETVIKYIEPQCSTNPNPIQAIIRSATNILDSQVTDINLENNFFANILNLPPPDIENCDGVSLSSLDITKTQISPELPIGASVDNTAQWGLVSYEVTVANTSDYEGIIVLQDFISIIDTDSPPILASLTSVECVETTGTTTCFDIQNTNIGVFYDGQPEAGEFDIFWQILPEENRILPANSSVTFNVTIDWQPECSIEEPMVGSNFARAGYVNGPSNEAGSYKTVDVSTFFAPCVDLVVQTYPEFTQVNTNQTFNWIIDISNSTTSSDATNVLFENTINPVFNIIGTPICIVSSGNATCPVSFDIIDNFISGTIPDMEAGSTVSISIPVTAPSFGGAFNNIAEAIPSAVNNEEITPETNISINSVQVVAPILQKSFMPDTIIEGGESELTFTVFNIASNPTQTNISFTDNLPTGIILADTPEWIEANGCTVNFIGDIGDVFVGMDNLVFPDGVASCTFSVLVTSSEVGTHLNNFQNFSNNNNIDTSQTNATLNVIIDTSDVDIEILKTVEPNEVAYGEEVEFTITATNLGTTTATIIEVIDALPQGYEFISATTSFGVFDENTFTWSIPSLSANISEILILTARIISSDNLINVAILNSVNEPDRNTSNNEDDATVEISGCLLIPEGLSPNNDGRNDALIIPCIEDYPENTLKIYNRYGTQIYEASNYLNTWDGRANMGFPDSSKLLPVGTYFYVLDIKGFQKPKVGYVYLNY